MQDQIYTIYHLTINPNEFDAFEVLAIKLVEVSRKETDTLTYEWLANADRTKAHIVERYRMPGLLPHVEQTFAPYAEEFLSLAEIDSLYVYGDPTPEIRAKLDTFGAIYLSPVTGFTR
jgi:quinol monooxygenase YgiN